MAKSKEAGNVQITHKQWTGLYVTEVVDNRCSCTKPEIFRRYCLGYKNEKGDFISLSLPGEEKVTPQPIVEAFFATGAVDRWNDELDEFIENYKKS